MTKTMTPSIRRIYSKYRDHAVDLTLDELVEVFQWDRWTGIEMFDAVKAVAKLPPGTKTLCGIAKSAQHSPKRGVVYLDGKRR